VDGRAERAARNNAEWCAAVCTLDGIASQFSDDAWTSPSRPRSLFPDAVTLVPSPSIPGLLARVDPAPGTSIKDSFAALELKPFGFSVLLQAQWITRAPASPAQRATAAPWTAVQDEAVLHVWNEAWRAMQGTGTGFPRRILANDEIVIGARVEGGAVCAGAILNRSDGAVGVSNVFTVSGTASDAWSECCAFAGSLFPGLPLVGYETADDLALAEARGFDAVGPLRIWVRD
jgi:hypothetical protein